MFAAQHCVSFHCSSMTRLTPWKPDAPAQWEPHPAIKAALDAGFYHAFRNVVPTGKRFLLGVDVSSSMSFCK